MFAVAVDSVAVFLFAALAVAVDTGFVEIVMYCSRCCHWRAGITVPYCYSIVLGAATGALISPC